jgi:hypothetical protein
VVERGGGLLTLDLLRAHSGVWFNMNPASSQIQPFSSPRAAAQLASGVEGWLRGVTSCKHAGGGGEDHSRRSSSAKALATSFGVMDAFERECRVSDSSSLFERTPAFPCLITVVHNSAFRVESGPAPNSRAKTLSQ